MFDNRLRLLREYKGLNMRQAAQQLKIPYTTYVGYEKNEREPNSEILILLADFFNCSVDYLIGREASTNLTNTTTNKTNKEKTLIKKYRTLDEHGKQVVDNVLELEYDRCIKKIS